VQFEVDQYATVILPVKVALDGTPPEGFEVAQIIVKPERLTVGGAQKTLQGLTSLEAGLVRVSDLRKERNVELEASSPSPDYWVVGPKKLIVNLQVREKQAEREMQLPVTVKNSIFPHTVNPPHVVVKLSGPYGTMQTLEAAQFTASIDASALKPGVYRRSIAIDGPDSVEVLSQSPQSFSVRINRGDR
jgi:YbbR domain-containing protein